MTIWAHTLVRNEERYIWFAVMSVIDYIDKVLIWDTGSEDKTVDIIKEIKKIRKNKVSINLLGKVSPDEFTKVRQEMLDKTKSDWFIIVDGDEVWWDLAIAKTTGLIRKHGKEIESIVNRYYNVVGDIYHYQEEAAGRYEIDGKVGHLNIRAMSRKISGLHFARPHGIQGVFDSKGESIQNRPKKKRVFLENPAYMHFTNVQRSSSVSLDSQVPKRKMKLKYEIGKSFPLDFYYPEVFFRPKPSFVPSPWDKISYNFFTRALLEKPMRILKRKFITTKSSGY
jgi:glycosyltransferase involved in cell wall biosynthesis